MRGRRKDFGAAGSAEYMYYMQVNTNLGFSLVTLAPEQLDIGY